mmetsp:Transcript_9113/g.31961  ORF Transcript_9113/g.31961 Transcript_9113/m.31961 type:complete len:324 (-) Transcript_9113:31-1002(-)
MRLFFAACLPGLAASLATGDVKTRVLKRRDALQWTLALAPALAAPLASPERAAASTPLSTPLLAPTDEFTFTFPTDAPLGIELESVGYARTMLGQVPSQRVAVRGVLQGGPAEAAGIRRGWILVDVNGVSLENLSADSAAKEFASAARPLTLRLRDPLKFTRQLRPPQNFEGIDFVLDSRSPLDLPDADDVQVGFNEGGIASTIVLPASAFSAEPQRLTVTKKRVPSKCSRGALRGDLLELRYEARLSATGALFDGSAISFRADGTTIAGRGGDSTVYYVYGMQPAGQFPLAWDPSLAGVCAGEVREISAPNGADERLQTLGE